MMMRALIVLAFFGCTLASPFLQDTPEVVAERARFMQLWNAQAAAAAAAPDTPHSHHSHHTQATHTPTFHSAQPHHVAPQGKWLGPVAATIPAGVQGSTSQVAETGDVAAARSAFLVAYRAQVAATTGHKVNTVHQFHPAQQTHHTFHQAAPHFNAIPAGPQKWTGPVAATIPAGVNGQITPVSETAEVAAARNAFFNTYNAAVAATRPVAATRHATHHQHATHQFVAPTVQHHHVQPAQARWTGPVAATIPAGLPGSTGQVGQTAAVAAATASFQQAYRAAVAATTGRRF